MDEVFEKSGATYWQRTLVSITAGSSTVIGANANRVVLGGCLQIPAVVDPLAPGFCVFTLASYSDTPRVFILNQFVPQYRLHRSEWGDLVAQSYRIFAVNETAALVIWEMLAYPGGGKK